MGAGQAILPDHLNCLGVAVNHYRPRRAAASRAAGSGCMLSGVVAAYVAANPESRLQAAAAAVSMFGLAGELAAARAERDGAGNATYSNYLIDGVFGMDAATLERGARHDLR